MDVHAGRDQPHVEAPASWTSHEDWDRQLPLLHSCRHDSSYKSPLMAQLLACIWHWAVSVEEYDVLFDAAALFPCRFRGEWDPTDREDCSFGSKDIAALLEGVPRPSVDTWSGARQCMDSLLPVEPSLWSPAGLEFEHPKKSSAQNRGSPCTAAGFACTAMRSCLRSASPVSACSLPRHRCVAFSFAVSFWFPAPDQIVLLPADSQCRSSVGLVPELSFDGGCCSSSVGFVSELSPAILHCPTPVHVPEPGVLVLSSGLPCSGLLGLPGSARSPSPALDVEALPEGQALLSGNSGHVHGHGGPGVSSVPSDAPSTPGSSQAVPVALCAQVPVDECSRACDLDLESAPFARVANHSGLPHPFTVFDEVHGTRVFAGEAGWTRQDFVRAALDNADLPGMPLVRFLRFEIVSLPTPQLVLTLDHGAIPHRGVVVDLQPLGGRVCVFDATNDASLADAYCITGPASS